LLFILTKSSAGSGNEGFPANYAKYYWGYLEILSLKEAAKEQMGEYYSDYAFHRFFLECGPSDFTTLHSKLKEE